ncbi:hypothetical protein OIU85_025124 [Salix viminalis]|uniref:Uncharacterized protein n=1 Tax=Salix viminalis TaxID=40686 RepID=A0A9Q0Z5E4_SALVM|nr:hypothetical protein OIU85_025124 [Salix viminalis]
MQLTKVGSFCFEKGVLSSIIHLTAAVNQTFPIYIKAGLASHILFKQANHLNLYTSTCLVYSMSQKDRLARIGLEGFAAIDEHFGRAKRRPPVPKVIDCNEAAQLYKGKVFIDYGNEAAQRYNGKVCIDNRRGKPVPF